MSLYDELSFIDLLGPIQGKFKVEFNEDGNPKVYLKPVLTTSSAWLSTMKKPDRACDLWQIYFYSYGIIPQGCRSCFKVVMSIPTLENLFEVFKYQRAREDNCKCGIEKRAYTGKLGGYTAYWYAPMIQGLAGARILWHKISHDFPDFEVILKRGCTEYEVMYNPSDSWDQLAKERQWDFKEGLLDTLFEPDPTTLRIEMSTPKMIEVFTQKQWIEWAFEHNDSTYLKYTSGPFKREILNYQNSEHSSSDYICNNYDLIQERVKYDSSEGSRQSSERKDALIQGLPED